MTKTNTQAPAATEAPIGVEHETIIVVPPPSLDELLKRADSIASALRGSRVNYHVEQEAASTIWELIEAVRLSAAPATAATEAQSIEVNDSMAMAFHRATSDGMIGHDDIEDIKIGLTAALCNVSETAVHNLISEKRNVLVKHFDNYARHLIDATPAPAVGASPEPILTEDEFCFLQRVEDTIRMFSEGKYPYDNNNAPNQKWRRATIADVEKRFKTMAPRFTALSIKLMAAMGASVQPVPATAADQMLGRYAEQADKIKELLDTHAPYTTGNICARVAQLLPVQPVQASLSDGQIKVIAEKYLTTAFVGARQHSGIFQYVPFARDVLASSTPTNPTKAE